jgi:hypothetical protein
MNAPETPPPDISQAISQDTTTPAALIVIQAEGADFCAADGTGC